MNNAICNGIFLLQELTPRTKDRLAGYGEWLSSQIIAAAFKENGIKIVFDENFWIEKPVEKEGIHTYSYINFGDESFQIPLNTKIQEYFFVQFKK